MKRQILEVNEKITYT